jgi:hypothetical protein
MDRVVGRGGLEPEASGVPRISLRCTDPAAYPGLLRTFGLSYLRQPDGRGSGAQTGSANVEIDPNAIFAPDTADPRRAPVDR